MTTANSTRVITLRVFGLEAEVTVPGQSYERVAEQWSWCAPDSLAQRDIALLEAPASSTPAQNSDESVTDAATAPDGETEAPIRCSSDLPEGADNNTEDYQLTTTLTAFAIGRRAGRLVMLHSGGIAGPDGKVAALIAASGTGKTTATRFFCSEAGFGYVSDETLIANLGGDVMPYPKPLSVLVDPNVLGHKSQHSPAELQMSAPPSGPLHLGPLILLNRLRDDAPNEQELSEADSSDEAPSLRPVDIIEGLVAILPQSSAVPQIPHSLHSLATLACRGGGILELTYRDIKETTHLIEEAMARGPVEPDWTHIPGNWPGSLDPSSPETSELYGHAAPPRLLTELPADARVVRHRFVDAISTDDGHQVLVLLGNTPAHLMGLGALIWLRCDEPRTVAELVDFCREEFGEHPDATNLVETCLIDLHNVGALTLA